MREAVLTLWAHQTTPRPFYQRCVKRWGWTPCSPVLPGLGKARRVQFHTLPIYKQRQQNVQYQKKTLTHTVQISRLVSTVCQTSLAGRGQDKTINKLITSAAKAGTAGQRSQGSKWEKNVPSSWDWNMLILGAKSVIWNKVHKNEDWGKQKWRLGHPKVWRASFQLFLVLSIESYREEALLECEAFLLLCAEPFKPHLNQLRGLQKRGSMSKWQSLNGLHSRLAWPC